jgi:hypothetical protein
LPEITGTVVKFFTHFSAIGSGDFRPGIHRQYIDHRLRLPIFAQMSS